MPIVFPMPIPKFVANVLRPVFRALQQVLTPIFDPSLLNDLDKYDRNKYKGAGVINLIEHWFPNVDIGAYVFPKEILPYIIPH